MPVQSDHVRQHRHDADRDGRVGDVERPEMPAAQHHVHEIDDGAERQAVDEVADGPAQDERQADPRQPLVRRHPRRIERDPNEGRRGDQGHDRRLVREVDGVQEPECGAGVAHVDDVEQVRNDRDGAMDRNLRAYQQLGRLVDRDDARDDAGLEREAARGPIACAAPLLVHHRAAASASSQRGHTPSRPGAPDTAGT